MTRPSGMAGHIADRFIPSSSLGIEGLFFSTIKESWFSGQSRVIVWFDPGSTTGWSVMCIDESAFRDPHSRITANFVAWSCGEFGGELTDVIDASRDLCARWVFRGAGFRGCLIDLGVEDFILGTRVKTREALDPVRVQAHIEYLADRRNVRYHRQQPSDKDIIDDGILRDLDLWDITRNQPHARDAIRHSLLFARRRKAGTVNG